MKTKIYFGLLALLFVLGCSNEELISNPSESNQLRKGNGVNSIHFNGNSIINDNYYSLVELVNDESGFSLLDGKFMLDGKFSGNITGFGKIISSSSTYTFDKPISDKNLNYNPINDREFVTYYHLTASGKISVGARDNCDINITGELWPVYYTPEDVNNADGLYGGMIDKGKAIITNGTGKLKNLNGTYYVQRGGGLNYFGINLSTGEISLRIGPKIE